MKDFILLAISDPVVLPEVMHAAAATGKEVVSCEDPRDIARFSGRATAIVTDRLTAAHVGACAASAVVLFVAAEPGPIDFEAALRARADATFLVPAEATEFLSALGNLEALARGRAPGGGQGKKGARGRCISVLGAAGGVGTSTFAATLARLAAPSVLVDGVPSDGGIDLLLGIEEVTGLRWPDVNAAELGISGEALRQGLPRTGDGIGVLSGARMPGVIGAQLGGGEKDNDINKAIEALCGAQLVVLDGALTDATDHAVVITCAQVRSVAAASQLLDELRARSVGATVVVRHKGWSSLTLEDVENILHVDVAAELPEIRGLAKTCESQGLPHSLPRALQRAGHAVLADASWVPVAA